MTVELLVDEAEELLYVTYSGKIDFDQLCQDVSTLVSLPNYNSVWNGISDFSKAKILYTEQDMMRFLEFVDNLPNSSSGAWAVIMPDNQAYNITTLWDALSRDIHAALFVCKDEQEARAWVQAQ